MCPAYECHKRKLSAPHLHGNACYAAYIYFDIIFGKLNAKILHSACQASNASCIRGYL